MRFSSTYSWYFVYKRDETLRRNLRKRETENERFLDIFAAPYPESGWLLLLIIATIIIVTIIMIFCKREARWNYLSTNEDKFLDHVLSESEMRIVVDKSIISLYYCIEIYQANIVCLRSPVQFRFASWFVRAMRLNLVPRNRDDAKFLAARNCGENVDRRCWLTLEPSSLNKYSIKREWFLSRRISGEEILSLPNF